MGQNYNGRLYIHVNRERGNLLVEFVLVLILIMGVVLGTAQVGLQYIRNIDHFILISEIMQGPQLPALDFDNTAGRFEVLSNSTDPTDTEFFNEIGSFFQSRAQDSTYAMFARLGYLTIDADTGKITGSLLLSSDYSVTKDGGNNKCSQNSLDHKDDLERYALSMLSELVNTGQSRAPLNDSDEGGRYGIKLYDFNMFGKRYRAYADYIPILFVKLCSEPMTVLYEQSVGTKHMIPLRVLYE